MRGTQPRRILVVEDDASLREIVVKTIEMLIPGAIVDAASDKDEALSKLHAPLWRLLIDLCLGKHPVGRDRNMDGLLVLLEARLRGLRAPAVIWTGVEDLAESLDVRKLGVLAVRIKPVTAAQLVRDLWCAEGAPVSEPPRPTSVLRADRRDYEREKVRQVLALHGGNKSAAARSLGVDRRTILRRVAEMTEMITEPPPARPPARKS